MNPLLTSLKSVCDGNPLQEKWILAPSFRIGVQWLDCLTKTNSFVMNARLKTVGGLAVELAGPELAASDLTYIGGEASLLAVHAVLNRLRNDPLSYFHVIPASMRFSAIALNSVKALRMARIAVNDIADRDFDPPEKARALKELLKEYVGLLQKNGLVDSVDVLEMACRALDAKPRVLNDVLVWAPECLDLTPLEQDMLNRIPGDQLIRPTLPRLDEALPEDASDVRRLRFCAQPETLTSKAKGDGAVKLFSAVGEINEVREIVRRCGAEGIHLDQVEILHTNYDTYAPLIYETVMGLLPTVDATTNDPSSSEQPTSRGLTPSGRAHLRGTFAEGIPARYSCPARGLSAFMSWIDGNYPQTGLIRMLDEGLLRVSEAAPTLADTMRLADALRRVSIGIGKPHYRERIEEAINKREAPSQTGSAQKLEDDASAQSLTDYQTLLTFTDRLLNECPDPLTFPAALKCGLVFLRDFAASENDLDEAVKERLVETLTKYATWSLEFGGLDDLDWREWIPSLVGNLRIRASAPRPGAVHVDHVINGGHSGRPYTFILGLDESKFPGAGASDPLLLDSPNAKIAECAGKPSQEVERKIRLFSQLFDLVEGAVTLSYSCHDIHEDRETFPGKLFIGAYRILYDVPMASLSDIKQTLGTPASFAPDAETKCLNMADWWLWRLSAGGPIADMDDALQRNYPHLSRGLAAAQARGGDELTEYDGYIGTVAAEHAPYDHSGPIMSQAKLETMGACPRRYFFRYILKISPPPDTDVNWERWLDGGRSGELLHDVYCSFMKEHILERRPPIFKRDISRLTAILEQTIERYKSESPPPCLSAFDRNCADLHRSAKVFLTEEEELGRSSRAQQCELPIGDYARPARIPLSENKTMKAVGRIDRLDKETGHAGSEFWIWDYKTGRSDAFTQKDPFRKGRLVQHAFYMLLADSHLNKKCHFGYFFTTKREAGLRIRHRRDDITDKGTLLEKGIAGIMELCDAITDGRFRATQWAEECTWCNYTHICGDTGEDRAKVKAQKSNAPKQKAPRKKAQVTT